MNDLRRSVFATTSIVAASVAIVIVVAGLSVRRASADGALGRGIPADAFLYLHCGPGDGALATRLAPFREALAASGFLTGLVEGLRARLVESLDTLRERLDEASDSRRRSLESQIASLELELGAFDRNAATWRETFERVHWWEIVARELVLAFRDEDGFLEWILVSRTGDETPQRVEELRRILYGHAATAESMQLLEGAREGADVAVLYSTGDDSGTLCLAGQDDVLVLTNSSRALRQVLRLFRGEGRSAGFSDTPAFAKDLASLDRRSPFAAAGSVGAERVRLVLRPDLISDAMETPLRGLRRLVAVGASSEGGFDYVYEARFEDGSDTLLARLCLGAPSIDAREWLVPEGTRGFLLSGGCSLLEAVTVAARLAEQFLPAGDAVALVLAAKLEGVTRSAKALLEALDGPLELLSLSDGRALVAGSKDPERVRVAWDGVARELLAGALGAVVSETPLPAGVQDGRLLRLAIPGADSFEPVIGCLGERFVLASDASVIERVSGAARKEPVARPVPEAIPARVATLGAVDVGELLPWLERGLAALPWAASFVLSEEEARLGLPFFESLVRLQPAVRALDIFGNWRHLRTGSDATIRGVGRVEWRSP